MIRVGVALKIPEVVTDIRWLGDPGQPIVHWSASALERLSLILLGGKCHQYLVTIVDHLDDVRVVGQHAGFYLTP